MNSRSSKSEARAARTANKKNRDEKKSERLRGSPEVRMGAASIARTPRLGADPGSIFHMEMTWTSDRADCEDCWQSGTPRQWTDDDWNIRIFPKLTNWQQLKWSEIEKATTDSGHKMHHSMPTDVICEEAVSRLSYLQIDGDSIYRFRLGNKPRLWGLRNVAEFEILWFDPEHEIYPTDVE
jgi:hypothetical protein